MVQKSLAAIFIEGEQTLTLADLSRGCELPAERIFDMIDYGIIEPIERDATGSRWIFSAECVPRLRTVQRLQRDLDVNLAGAALALELLDEVKSLRQQVLALRR